MIGKPKKDILLKTLFSLTVDFKFSKAVNEEMKLIIHRKKFIIPM